MEKVGGEGKREAEEMKTKANDGRELKQAELTEKEDSEESQAVGENVAALEKTSRLIRKEKTTEK